LKIAYVSNTEFPWCTESEVTTALRCRGDEVVNIQEDEATPDEFMGVATSSDLVLWTRTWSRLVTLEDLKRLGELGIPTPTSHPATAGDANEGGPDVMLDNLDDRLLTLADLSEMLEVPIHTLHRWRQRGDGPAGCRVGKHVRYRRAAVEASLEGRADGGS
jgi:hypothetical protein